MRDLGRSDGDVEELDGRGLSAIPASSTATRTRASRATGSRSSRCAPGRGYEELHARGGGILSTVRATRAAGDDGLAAALERARRLDAARRHDDLRGEVGLRARPRDRARAAPRRPRRGRRPDLARRARRAARVRRPGADAYLDFLLADVLPEAARIAEAADVFLERGAFDAEQARRYLVACADAGLALRLHGDQFTEAGAIPLAIELGARSVDHLEATGADGSPRSPRATSPACCFRRARSSSTARCRPPRARRRRRGRRARDRLQPGQRVLREPAARLLARRDADAPRARGGARGVHGQRRARARPRRPQGPARAGLRRRPRPRRGRTTGGTSPTTSADRVVHTVIAGGKVAWSSRA